MPRARSQTRIRRPGSGTPESREVAGGRVIGRDRSRVLIGLEDAAVDGVDDEPAALGREGHPERRFGHSEGGEDRAALQPVGRPGGGESLDRSGVDRLRTIEGQRPPPQVESLEPAQRAAREHVREVGSGGGSAAEGVHPLHPPGGPGEEVLRSGEREIHTGRHGRGRAAR